MLAMVNRQRVVFAQTAPASCWGKQAKFTLEEKIMNFRESFSVLELYKCHKLCRRNKQHKNETINFELNLCRNINELSRNILSHKYKPNNYRSFYVHEPKKRLIDSLSYGHRLVQRSICDNILKPKLEPYLIYDNVACRIGKGTHFALERLKKFLRMAYLQYGKDIYFLQCDIKKYFQSINHKILKQYIKELKLEEESEDLILKYIDSYSFSGYGNNATGIPIGNQTSQWFALLYLNKMDRFIKEKLHIKFYIRYMDDFVLLHHDKESLKFCLNEITKFVNNIKLSLNHKTQINKISRGISFLGFRTILLENGKVFRLISGSAKRRLKNNYRKSNFLFKYGAVDEDYLRVRFQSYKNHLFHGNCHKWFYMISKRYNKYDIKPEKK